jgi:phage terminase large subunit-like protein
LSNEDLILLREKRRRRAADANQPSWTPRPNQVSPTDEWLVWYIQAGRGWGKTRTGAEWLYERARHVPHVAIVAESFGEARDTCIEGESGIKALHPDVRFNRSLGELYFPNGCRGKVYSADDPESLRGPNNYAAWCDEIAKWRYLKLTWDNLMFTMRKGERPQTVVTTTPRPLPFLKEIKARATTHLTTGSTYENLDNLSPAYIDIIVKPYEGTQQGRQELHAEDIEDTEGALWKRAWLEAQRLTRAPELIRIVTGLDPSATAGGDEAGVITAGIGPCSCTGESETHGFVLSDDSVQASPEKWAAAAVTAYHKFKADALIAEDNNGGEMVSVTIKTVPHAPPVKRIHASRGKHTRAEPISMLYQQRKVHHVGAFPRLEDELCSWVQGDDSPNRLDALVWALTELMVGSDDVQVRWLG